MIVIDFNSQLYINSRTKRFFFLFSIYGELDENKKQKIKSLKDIKIYDETKKIS